MRRLCLVSNKTLKKAGRLKLFCTYEQLDRPVMSSKVEYPSSGSQRSENHASISRKASTAPSPVFGGIYNTGGCWQAGENHPACSPASHAGERGSVAAPGWCLQGGIEPWSPSAARLLPRGGQSCCTAELSASRDSFTPVFRTDSCPKPRGSQPSRGLPCLGLVGLCTASEAAFRSLVTSWQLLLIPARMW